MTLRSEQDGPVLVVTIDRPEARNAVDRPTAHLLADAFRAFDTNDHIAVAVLTGANGTFCAGADLKGVASGRGKRIGPRRADGAHPDVAVQAGPS